MHCFRCAGFLHIVLCGHVSRRCQARADVDELWCFAGMTAQERLRRRYSSDEDGVCACTLLSLIGIARATMDMGCRWRLGCGHGVQMELCLTMGSQGRRYECWRC